MPRTIAQAEALAEILRALPAVENRNRVISKAEEVKILADEITALQSRNYTLQQIAEILTSDGLEIGTGTLKNYLQRSKSIKRNSKKKTNSSLAVSTIPTGNSIGERAAASLPEQGDSHQLAQAAITRPDRTKI